MEPSLPGLLVAAVLLVLGRQLGGAVIVGLLISIPLQSTAFAVIPALGGSTPPVATLFAVILALGALIRPGAARTFKAVVLEQWTLWVLAGLTVYAAVGAYLLPRLFQGQTSAFIPILGSVFEVPLSPVGGNITQSGYFVVGSITVLCLSMALRRLAAWRAVSVGMLALVACHVAMGFLNLLGNLAGAGDVLLPIRTANYAILAEQFEGGLFRIAGACPEASVYAVIGASCLAFCVAFWRRCGSHAAFALGSAQLALLLLSTSTTAYVTLALLGAPLFLSILAGLIRGQSAPRDLQLLGLGCAGLVLGLAILLLVPQLATFASDLIDTVVFKKHLSSSGQERGYWNAQSVRAFFDTYGLGVGLGSSRASSWLVAVLSQIGAVGALGFAVLLVELWRTPHAIDPTLRLPNGYRLKDFAAAIRAATMAALVGQSISGGAVDPGVFVFCGFAIVFSAAPLANRMAATRTLQRARTRTARRPDHFAGETLAA